MSLISTFATRSRPRGSPCGLPDGSRSGGCHAARINVSILTAARWQLHVGSYKKSIIFLLFLFSPWISLYAVEQIKVPLGCSWGDDQARLDELIHAGGLTMISSEAIPTTQKKVVTVRGVIGAALKQNIFVFQKEELVEIEYQYGNANWDAKKYQEFFDNFRRMFENKYGPGTPLSKTTNAQTDLGGIITSINGYEWAQSFCILDLFYYTAERGDQRYRLISVHYKMP